MPATRWSGAPTIGSLSSELEERIDSEPWRAGDQDDVPSGDELAEEVEKFLRDHDDDAG